MLTHAPRVVVLHRGEVVEEGPAARVAVAPSHPHTHALLDAVPRLRPPSSAALAAQAG